MSLIIFLDFDGVTHPERCRDSELFCCIPLIEETINSEKIKVVISSSWKNTNSLEQIRDLFSAEFRDRIIDTTPNFRKPLTDWIPEKTPFERQWEIESWMKKNRPLSTPWIAIDDRHYWFSSNNPNLLITNRRTGFDTESQRQLIQMIKERL